MKSDTMRSGPRAQLTCFFSSPSLILWALYIVFSPFYVFKSGLPQPGDMLIIIVVPVTLYRWDGRLRADAAAVVRALFRFIAWVLLVNVGWAIVTLKLGIIGPDNFLLFPIYYIYNGLVVLAALVLYRRFDTLFLRVTGYAVTVTVAVLCITAFIYGRSASRGTLFFENPNQLGYFALLSACMLLMTYWRLGMRTAPTIATILGCGYLGLYSASRAAVGGIALLLVVLAFASPRALILASLCVVGAVALGSPIFEEIEAAQNRGQHAQFFQERRYDRILKHLEYVPLGAGEGGLSRFATEENPKPIEIHSAPATILFSYGLLGCVLFSAFLWRLLRAAPIRLALALVPVLAYTVAHQGLRFTMLWVLLAVFVALKADSQMRIWALPNPVLLRRGTRIPNQV